MRKFLVGLLMALAGHAALAAVETPDVPVTTPDGTVVQIKVEKVPPKFGPEGSAAAVVTMAKTPFVPVNAASLMKPKEGHSDLRIAMVEHPGDPDNDFNPGDDSTGMAGSFRIHCPFSHMLFDDPIVYPGQAGMSHLHVFFANSDVNAMTDTAKLEATSTRSTCAGGIANRSGYWVSAIVDMRTANAVRPKSNEVYYKEAGSYGQLNPGLDPARKRSIQPFPTGLRMIAGDPGNTTGDTRNNPNPALYYVAPAWSCNAPDGTITIGGKIPGVECPNGSEIIQLVYFPNCWDGRNLDSPDHKSHMAYANDSTPNNHPDQGCPASHPIPVPWLSFNVHYEVDENNRPENWRLSSDNYAHDKPGGGSSHGDFIFGWDPDIFLRVLNNCIRKANDCHTNLLGDHYTFY